MPFNPGMERKNASSSCEWKEPKVRPPPQGRRNTSGHAAPERKCIVAALSVICVVASVAIVRKGASRARAPASSGMWTAFRPIA